jgi:hypothetical protein
LTVRAAAAAEASVARAAATGKATDETVVEAAAATADARVTASREESATGATRVDPAGTVSVYTAAIASL